MSSRTLHILLQIPCPLTPRENPTWDLKGDKMIYEEIPYLRPDYTVPTLQSVMASAGPAAISPPAWTYPTNCVKHNTRTVQTFEQKQSVSLQS